MDTTRLRVVVGIEPYLLSSAIEQFLARNPRLDVAVTPADVAQNYDGHDAHTIRIGLLDDPFRFELQRNGNTWLVDYQGFDALADLLCDLAHREGDCERLPVHRDRP